MSLYSLYFLSLDESIKNVWEIEFICDEVAISAAKREADGRLFELWHKERLVFWENSNPL